MSSVAEYSYDMSFMKICLINVNPDFSYNLDFSYTRVGDGGRN